MGFKISDFDISFKKSQMQFSVYQKEVSEKPKDLCDDFIEKLNESPHKILDAMKGKEGSEWSRRIKEFGEA